jgi:cyclic pyranopterin phosphate synthase
MYDRFGRDIRYLRISVTTACNLACTYCVPDAGGGRPGSCGDARRPSRLLTFDEIVLIAQAAVALDITKVRLTGGEPLLRPRLSVLVRRLKRVPGLEHVALTTNGVLLSGQALALKEAGLDSVNVSLDTLSPDRYTELTGGDIRAVLRGILAAREAGIPVKINAVVLEDGEAETGPLREYCAAEGLGIQLIERFHLDRTKITGRRYDRPHRCEECDRIRLLADGTLKPCLHTNQELDVDFRDLEGSLRRCIEAKPPRGGVCTNRHMVEIGG